MRAARRRTTNRPRTARATDRASWGVRAVTTLAWVAVALVGVALMEPAGRPAFVAAAGVGLAVSLAVAAAAERRQWVDPVHRIAGQVDALAESPTAGVEFAGPSGTAELVRALNGLSAACKRRAAQAAVALQGGEGGAKAALTRSALFRAGKTDGDSFDPYSSNEFPTADMVNRLEPKLLRWLESSPAEQRFLGWDLAHLREKSFLEIIHPDDAKRVRDALRAAAVRGEFHGLILRIRTAHGKAKVIEMDVGARYGADLSVTHLRCHLADITAKVRADRELKLRNREIMQVNDQLRLINRELRELQERYRDLYQNAPAMYFSLDVRGRIVDCNETLLRTLGYDRDAVVGHSYQRLMPEAQRPKFVARFAQFQKEGSIELASQWVKAGGEVIDVWVTGTAVRDPEGRLLHSRSVAQDVTARHQLEAELQEKNARLARTNDELFRRNKEMDEFTYVVSHDLQEPLRTLIAFSDFLLRDYGDRLDAEGQEFVRHIVDASRRMRDLINDLLSLSRVGRVTADFARVSLDEIVTVLRADLAELIRSRGAELNVVGPLPEVWGDRVRIGQLLGNLIGNGLKYNDKPVPRVEVFAAPGPRGGDGAPAEDPAGWLTLAVRDNGIGIEPQFHAKIFQLFRRLHTREQYEGTGAGLAICSKIVQAHGGRISVESQPGRGSTFYVTLRRPPAEPTDDHPPADQPAEASHAT